MKCLNFCADECTNGFCPKALAENCDYDLDYLIDVPKSCKSCYYNSGLCKDCMWIKDDGTCGLEEVK